MVALALAAAAWQWSLGPQVIANGLQLLGILVTGCGIVVIWSWLARTADQAIEAKQRLEHSWARRSYELRCWWARMRGHPQPTVRRSQTWSSRFVVSDELVRAPRDATGLAQHKWLLTLDAEMDAAYTKINALRHDLGKQRDELRDEIQRETRQGWQLIVAGLAWSAFGTVVGIFA